MCEGWKTSGCGMSKGEKDGLCCPDGSCLHVLTKKNAKHAAKIFVKACREQGEDIAQHVGLEASAAALGFRRWNDAVAALELGDQRTWSHARFRARFLELAPGIEPAILDTATAILQSKWGFKLCS